MNYPVDIYTTDNGIQFDIAAVGKEKKDIEIITEGETLRIKYTKGVDEHREYIHKGIAKRAFDFAWKISKVNLSPCLSTYLLIYLSNY